MTINAIRMEWALGAEFLAVAGNGTCMCGRSACEVVCHGLGPAAVTAG